MAQSITKSNLAGVVTTEFASYFRHLGERVEKAATAVPEEQIWIKPFPFGNSIGHLLLHLTGNLNHYIGALIAGSGYVRQREHEFTDDVQHPREQLLAQFRVAVVMVVRTLDAQDDASLSIPVESQHPIQTRLGLFLVCASHLNNHIGQMSYLVQALKATTKEPPVW